MKKMLLIVSAWAIGVMVVMIGINYYSKSTNSDMKQIVEDTLEVRIIESVSERQFKSILKAYHEKDWNSFNKKVDIGLMVKNDIEEALNEARKEAGTQKKKEALELIESWIPLAVEHTKGEFYDYFTRGTSSSNLSVKMFSLHPNKILGEKDDGTHKILSVSYIGEKNKSEIIVDYIFIKENDEWKLVGTRNTEELGKAMGWKDDSSDMDKEQPINNNYAKYGDHHYDNTISYYSQKENTDYYANEKDNAYKTAYNYANNGIGMSKNEVYEQLLFEGFSENDARNAIDKLTMVDWNVNAYNAALSYQREQHMSKSAIREQLLFQGFTSDETNYAVNRLK